MTTNVFIDGAAGTTGLEIGERLADRSEFDLIILDQDRRKDTNARREALNDCDVAILCLPDDAAREAVALLDKGSNTRIIDASSAHRTAPGWAYGFPELVGSTTVAEASLVSNPGCYPTGFLALIAPLVRSGLLPASWPFTVNAVSGYSGGGNALIARFREEPDIAWRGYGYGLDHKHLPEMRTHAGLDHAPVFAPAVVPAMRGMVVEVPVPLAAIPGSATAQQMHAALVDHYGSSQIVSVADFGDRPSEILLRADAAPWDGMELAVLADDAGTQARLIARLDNLGKGASGAAVQNLNLISGLPQETGLRLPA